MSNFADLANCFKHMGLEDQKKQPNYHELQIEYPVLDLPPVEGSVTPLLKPPSTSRYREKPDPSEYHLPLSGTEFFFQVIAESELSGIPWAAECSPLRREPWMRLVLHLLHRISNRAYSHIYERLKHYRCYTKQIAEEQWNFKDSFNPKRFFAAHLHIVVGTDLGERYAEAAIEQDLEGEGEGIFLLPCGHEQVMSILELRTASIRDCLLFACGHCFERLARRADNWRHWLLAHRQVLRCARFSVRELVWKQIAEEFPIGNQQVTVSSTVLYKALQYAADSVVPQGGFWSQLQGEYEQRRTSAGILSGLEDKLDRAVGRALSSGHATQLAGISGYDGREPPTVFENQTVVDEGSVNGNEEDEQIDELEQMMKGVKLN
ncbi:hypothetical protein MBLNU13_g07462t1 [Cladosporium sp. NU13]